MLLAMVIIAQFENINTNVTKQNIKATSVTIHSRDDFPPLFEHRYTLRPLKFLLNVKEKHVIGLAQMSYFYLIPPQPLIVL